MILRRIAFFCLLASAGYAQPDKSGTLRYDKALNCYAGPFGAIRFVREGVDYYIPINHSANMVLDDEEFRRLAKLRSWPDGAYFCSHLSDADAQSVIEWLGNFEKNHKPSVHFEKVNFVAASEKFINLRFFFPKRGGYYMLEFLLNGNPKYKDQYFTDCLLSKLSFLKPKTIRFRYAFTKDIPPNIVNAEPSVCD